MNNIINFNNSKIPVRLFRNEEVKFENNAIEELQNFLLLSETIERIKEYDSNFLEIKMQVLLKLP